MVSESVSFFTALIQRQSGCSVFQKCKGFLVFGVLTAKKRSTLFTLKLYQLSQALPINTPSLWTEDSLQRVSSNTAFSHKREAKNI